MKFRDILFSCTFFLIGCQNAQVIDTSQPSTLTVSTLQQLEPQDIKLSNQTTVLITDTTRRLENQEIQSPVASFHLPMNKGPLSIEIASLINNTVFSPLAVIYDENGNKLEQLTAKSFNYVKPRFIYGNRLVGRFIFIPPTTVENATLIVYTSKAELDKTTNVIHPARLEAEIKGYGIPDIPDIPIPHSLTGEFIVEIEPYTSSSSIFNNISDKPNAQLKSAEKADNANTPATAEEEINMTVTNETKAYYVENIKKEIKNNNMDKAFNLLDEAKALDIEDIESIFIEAVKERK